MLETRQVRVCAHEPAATATEPETRQAPGSEWRQETAAGVAFGLAGAVCPSCCARTLETLAPAIVSRNKALTVREKNLFISKPLENCLLAGAQAKQALNAGETVKTTQTYSCFSLACSFVFICISQESPPQQQQPPSCLFCPCACCWPVCIAPE